MNKKDRIHDWRKLKWPFCVTFLYYALLCLYTGSAEASEAGFLAVLIIALLIDADNVSVKYIKIILDEISKDGIATYKRIYGDWTNPSLISWKSTLLDNSIIPVQQYSYTTGKNSTDSAMIIDAMDILYSGRVEGFCLVSSDSDFTRLAARLRESGMNVIGMGEKKTPNAFIAACNKFKYLDILSAADEAEAEEAAPKAEPAKKPAAQPKKTAQKAAAKKPKEEPKAEKEPKPAEPKKQQEKAIEEPRTSLRTIRRALRTIVRENSDEDNWIMVSQVGNLLDKRYTDFDVRNFGSKSLNKFLASLPELEVEERILANGNPIQFVRVKPVPKPVKKPAPRRTAKRTTRKKK